MDTNPPTRPKRSPARSPRPSTPPLSPGHADLTPFPSAAASASAPPLGPGTVQLARQPVHVIAKAISTALALGPVRHLRIPAAWGASLPELLDSVLPTIGSQLISLDLSQCNLRHWPQSLRTCTQLEELTLSGNPLGNPPSWLSELAKLRHLILDHIGLSCLPAECATMEHLTSLSLAHNQLTQPPIWLYHLPHLSHLCLDANPFEPPWSEIVAPLISQHPRASTSSSAEASLFDSPLDMSPNQINFSSPFLTSASTVATSSSYVLPSPRSSQDMSDGSIAAKTPTKSSKLGLRSPSKMLSTITLSPTPQRWTARLKRTPKTDRTASSPVRPLVLSPGSADVPTGNSLYPGPGLRARSASGPAYEEHLSPSRRTSNVSAKSVSRTSQQSSLGLGWPGAASRSFEGEDETESHARQVKTMLQYLQDLDALHPPTPSSASFKDFVLPPLPTTPHSTRDTVSDPSTPPSSASSVRTRSVVSFTSASRRVSISSQSTAPLPSLGPGLVMAKDSGVAEHVQLLQSTARDEPSRRCKVLEELIGSEQTYVQGLKVLVDVYVAPCKSFNEKAPISLAQQKIVFSNVETLLRFHQSTFLPALRKAASPLLSPSEDMLKKDLEARSLIATKQVAQVFSEHAAFLRMYATYTINCDLAQQIVMSWGAPSLPPSASQGAGRKRSSIAGPSTWSPSHNWGQETGKLSAQERKAIHKYLKKASADPRTSALGLDSYLLLPVQRIPRYRLMLEDLVRCVPATAAQEVESQSASESLASALASVLTVAQGMNEAKRQADQETRLYAWHEHFMSSGVYQHARLSTLVQPRRRLLKDGVMTLERLVRPGVSPAHSATNPDSAGREVEEPSELSRSKTVVPPRANVSVLHQDMVGDQKVTVLLCNDLLLLLEEQKNGPDVPSVPHGPNGAPQRRRSSAFGISAPPALSVPSRAPTRKVKPQLKAVIDLTRPSTGGTDQLTVEGRSVRVRDTHTIYYLSTSSEAAANEWASLYRSARDEASCTS